MVAFCGRYLPLHCIIFFKSAMQDLTFSSGEGSYLRDWRMFSPVRFLFDALLFIVRTLFFQFYYYFHNF